MFSLGNKSLQELEGVHPDLKGVVLLSIELTLQDFGVHDGLRTLGEQQALVNAGASKTLNSKHRKQVDGFGHAVDLVPFINGKLRWEWPPIFTIARAVRAAAIRKCVPIVWGAVWDRNLNDLSENLEMEVENYKKRHAGSDFLDGPHYQLSR